MSYGILIAEKVRMLGDVALIGSHYNLHLYNKYGFNQQG